MGRRKEEENRAAERAAQEANAVRFEGMAERFAPTQKPVYGPPSPTEETQQRWARKTENLQALMGKVPSKYGAELLDDLRTDFQTEAFEAKVEEFGRDIRFRMKAIGAGIDDTPEEHAQLFQSYLDVANGALEAARNGNMPQAYSMLAQGRQKYASQLNDVHQDQTELGALAEGVGLVSEMWEKAKAEGLLGRLDPAEARLVTHQAHSLLSMTRKGLIEPDAANREMKKLIDPMFRASEEKVEFLQKQANLVYANLRNAEALAKSTGTDISTIMRLYEQASTDVERQDPFGMMSPEDRSAAIDARVKALQSRLGVEGADDGLEAKRKRLEELKARRDAGE